MRTGVTGDFFGGRPGPFFTGVVADCLGGADVDSALESLSELLDDADEEPDSEEAEVAADLSDAAPDSFFCLAFWFKADATLFAILLGGIVFDGEEGPSLSLLFSGLNMLLVLFFLSACFEALDFEEEFVSLDGAFF